MTEAERERLAEISRERDDLRCQLAEATADLEEERTIRRAAEEYAMRVLAERERKGLPLLGVKR